MRTREEVVEEWNNGTKANEYPLFMEVLLDIRDLLSEMPIAKKEK